jgi:hypothetical protein
MKNTFSILLIILYLPYLKIQSQDFVSVDTSLQRGLKLQKFNHDTTIEAMVLFNIGKVSFIEFPNNGFKICKKITTRIKIFSDNGLKYANKKIHYSY